jgi:hypothetical protein
MTAQLALSNFRVVIVLRCVTGPIMGSFLDWSMRLSWQAESKFWRHTDPFFFK